MFDHAIELPGNMSTNEHVIELIHKKQFFFGHIYALSLVRLETLKNYIEIYFKTGFIQPSKSLVSALILINIKLDSNFCMCVNY